MPIAKLNRFFAAADGLLAVVQSPHAAGTFADLRRPDPLQMFAETGRMFKPSELADAARFLSRLGFLPCGTQENPGHRADPDRGQP